MNFRQPNFIYIIIVIITCIAIDKTNAQVPIRDFNAEPIQVGARALSLGDAYVSDPYDVNSFYWNPASLAFLQTNSIAANSIISWNSVVMKNTVAVPYSINSEQAIALGGEVSYLGYFRIKGLDLGYARRLAPNFSAGLSIDLAYATSRTAGLWGASGSLGVLYTPSPGASYALVYKGFGSNVHYLFYGVEEVLEHTNPLRSVQIGTTFWFPSVNRKPYVCISFASEKTFGVDKLANKMGIEILTLPYLAIRCGLISGLSAVSGRAGLGLFINRFRFDYAIAPSRAEERLHEISVSFIL
jgi:hypothetical protein